MPSPSETARIVKEVVAGTSSLGGLEDSITLTQQTAITDASEAHALNATFSDTEAEAALDALGAKINAIIAALEAVGILAE